MSDMDGDGGVTTQTPALGLWTRGICNGRAIYPCGCIMPPAGDCDVTAISSMPLGYVVEIVPPMWMAMASATTKTSVGTVDVCGVCNGPGDMFNCGCDMMPMGDCDCDGNQLDAVGVCGGDCQEDWNGNGVCDTEEVKADGCDGMQLRPRCV